MNQPVPDRHVLLGDLALHLNLLTAESLASARSEWQSDPTRSLGQLLVGRGLLSEKALVALETLVEIQLTHAELPGVRRVPCHDPLRTWLPVAAADDGAASATGRSR